MGRNDNTRQMLVPVTIELQAELAASGRVLAQLERENVTDRNHYRDVVDTLELLVIRTLGATSSVPLTKRPSAVGARFDMGAGTPITHHVNRVVTYLRDEASELLRKGSFGMHDTSHAEQVLGLLKQLHGMILSGILKQAEADLSAIRSASVDQLLVMSDTLAKTARAGHLVWPKQDEQDPATDLVARG